MKTARKKPKPPKDLAAAKADRPFPSREQIRDFLAGASGRVGKREAMRAFGLGPEHRVAMRSVLKEMAARGEAAPAGHKRFTAPHGSPRLPGRASGGRLPEAIIVEITGIDSEGDAIGRPAEWRGDGPSPTIFMQPEARGQAALAPGQRVLARIKPIGEARGARKFEGRTLRRIEGTPGRVIGIFRRRGGLTRIEPTDKRVKAEWIVPPGEDGGAEDGEIVRGEPLPMGGLGLKPVRVVERLGDAGSARAVSLLVIATLDIPDAFTPEVLAEAARAQGVGLEGREDLRDIPLVTIDGADARDFDDAVFAEPAGDGYRLIVAIADVAHYVRPGSALDRSARERGNSVYFPDRVVPMLPEALSNGWCSLRPNEDRACLFVEMRIGSDGRKVSHRFGRGLMRSAARLTYEEVQEARDTKRETPGFPLGHLYGAFGLLLGARRLRGTLDLDLPEWKVTLDAEGHVTSVAKRQRLDSHRLIEEFMVLANIAAAEELERLHKPVVYRVHAPPSEMKLEGLRTYLHGMSISLPPGDQIHPRDLDAVLSRVAGTEAAPLVNDAVLRSQSQAAYSTENLGHFGLALTRYAHFTSPIRRYADLLVHRSLIGALGFGRDGLTPEEAARLEDTCEHITRTERRAAQAERDATDRYMAAFMADKIGCMFDARISGVTRFGLFVTLTETGASGMIPLAGLPDDFWMHDEQTQSLSGRRSRVVFHLAQAVTVRLTEARPVTGGLLFQMPPWVWVRVRRRRPPGGRPFAPRRPLIPHATPVNRGAFFAVLVLILPLRAEAQSNWNQSLAGSVYATAFAFMAPRTLGVIPLAELTLWGLRGLTALDPSVGPTMDQRSISLVDREQIVLSMPLPRPDDAAGWGAVAAELCGSAAQLSPAIAEAGTSGIVTSFFDELFNHLDPYSRYVPSTGAQAATATGDPGLTIAIIRHHAVIDAVDPGGSAAAAGLTAGERVLAIDGMPTRGQDAYALNAALGGPPGSEVTLDLLLRREHRQAVALTRMAASPPTVFATRQGPMLVIQIAGFEQGTAEAFRAMLTAALAGGPAPRGIVLDLRGNRGGLLDQAVAVAGNLIDPAQNGGQNGGLIGSAVGRYPAADQSWRASNGDLALGQRVVVLVDGRTASAAEVLAAALADDGRGVVVGSATFGKGLVQAATTLPDGGTLLVTWARLLAPLGWPLQGLGVMPQICTSGTTASVEAQLEALSAGQQPMGAAIRAARAARPGITLDQILQIREACPAALGSSLDMQTAQFLVTTPPAYAAAAIAP